MNALRHSGNLLLILFGVMLVLMSLLVYRSATQPVSMVSKNYYEQELQYQHQLDAMNNTRQLDREFALSAGSDSVRLQVPVSISQTLTSGKLHFYCPSDDKADVFFSIGSSTDGRYAFSRSGLKGHGYILKMDLDAEGKAYYKEIKLP